MAIDILFEKVKTFIAKEGAKSGQEIMDHLNVAAPVARSIMRDMVLKRELVHRKGLYYLANPEGLMVSVNKREIGGKKAKVQTDETATESPVKVERESRKRARDARQESFEARKRLFEEHAAKAPEPKEE